MSWRDCILSNLVPFVVDHRFTICHFSLMYSVVGWSESSRNSSSQIRRPFSNRILGSGPLRMLDSFTLSIAETCSFCRLQTVAAVLFLAPILIAIVLGHPTTLSQMRLRRGRPEEVLKLLMLFGKPLRDNDPDSHVIIRDTSDNVRRYRSC